MAVIEAAAPPRVYCPSNQPSREPPKRFQREVTLPHCLPRASLKKRRVRSKSCFADRYPLFSLIVIVFAIFILLYRQDLRDRFIRLAGSRDLRRTTAAMDDAAGRLSRYLLTQTAINGCFGAVIGTGLWLIGIPNPLLWGIFGALMRFVPYIGAFIAAAFPAALAIAVDPGWSMLIWTVALFVIIEPILGQVVEPWLYGHNTGLSPWPSSWRLPSGRGYGGRSAFCFRHR
jgi:AI-2E family transporter